MQVEESREQLNDYSFVTRAAYDRQKKAWFVRVNISWREDGLIHTNTLNPTKYFETVAEATEAGFRLAELWSTERELANRAAGGATVHGRQ